jgi:hypothetical protein
MALVFFVDYIRGILFAEHLEMIKFDKYNKD